MRSEAWTDAQRRGYQRAMAWAEEQLPPPVAQAFSTWYLRTGRELFDRV